MGMSKAFSIFLLFTLLSVLNRTGPSETACLPNRQELVLLLEESQQGSYVYQTIQRVRCEVGLTRGQDILENRRWGWADILCLMGPPNA